MKRICDHCFDCNNSACLHKYVHEEDPRGISPCVTPYKIISKQECLIIEEDNETKTKLSKIT